MENGIALSGIGSFVLFLLSGDFNGEMQKTNNECLIQFWSLYFVLCTALV